MTALLLALAVLPVLVLAFFVYRQDRFEKEPLPLLIKCFFFGMLSVIPAIFMEQALDAAFYLPLDTSFTGVLYGAYKGFVVAGFSEELCKLLLLSWAVWKSPHFDEYFDGIVYAAFVSLGFACVENVMYVFNQGDLFSALVTGSMRAVLSVPGHFLFGVTMGYFFALAKFQPERRSSHLLKALLVPVLLHGSFDALLMIPEAMGEGAELVSGLMFVIFIYFDIRLWKSSMKRLRHLQELSSQQAEESGSHNYYDSDDDSGFGDGFDGGFGGNYSGNQGNTSQDGDAFRGFKWDV